MGRVTSHKSNGDFVPLGMLGTRSDDGRSIQVWNEQVSRAL